jgi:choline dehydrogenase-like flavoprotein
MTNFMNGDTITCEYLIIGSGAGGSVACKHLIDQGKNVLLIEEGNHYKINEFNGSISKSFLNAWRNSGVTPVLSKSSYGIGEGKCLGGGTYINGGLIWRTPEIVLEKWNKTLSTNKFSANNVKKYFLEIEKNLNLNINDDQKYPEGNDSLKLSEIGKKFNIAVSKVPKSINSTEKLNKLTLGSPGETANSILQRYIYPCMKKDLKILTNCRAEKLVAAGNKIISIEVMLGNKRVNIKADKVILACGATQTPTLIKNSFGSKFLNSKIDVHLNLRIGVKFIDKIKVNNGIMFTRQIQEYLNDGVLIMPTSFNKNSFFSGLAKMNNQDLSQIEEKIDNYANFVIQIQSQNKVNLYNFNKNLFLTYKLSSNDLLKIKKYFIFFCNALFETGAEEIILPLKKNYLLNKEENYIDFIENNFTPKNLEMISVHATSSAKMGLKKTNQEIFNIDGKSFDFENLFCVDSSILPTSTIESPQATIMMMSKIIVEQI